MKTGILVHGLHVDALGWQMQIWGEPPYKMGSLPKMVHAVLLEGFDNITLIVFGTGASERDGLKEAECMKQFLADHLSGLSQFSLLTAYDNFRSLNLHDLLKKIVLDVESQNTLEEIRNAARLFSKMGVSRVIEISRGSHMPRCVQNSLQARTDGDIPPNQLWYAFPDDQSFFGTTVNDVTILEPPHRGDDPMRFLSRDLWPSTLAKRIFKIPFKKRADFLNDLAGLLKNYEV